MIKFPLITEDGEGNNRIVYPESNRSLFKNVRVDGNYIVCDYSGDEEYEEYVEKSIAPTKMTVLNFMHLVGDENMVKLITLAKTDPIAELLVKKIDRASMIDYEDAVMGPQSGLQYLYSQGQLNESEYTRIMNREYPE